ncbi:MAG: DMT family transporter [Bacteroidaceae bacterium]|jgi:drug/metabolite transporter (DMT)-like permease|nr:DMT family transporter [Bacteroidaceae bacterium]
MKQYSFLYHLTAFVVVAIWGSTFVFTKLLLMNGLSAAHIFTLRFIIAYVLLLCFALTRRGFRLWSDNWKDEMLMACLGLTGGSLYFLTENSAMNYTTTTNTSLIVCCCPLFAALLIGGFYRSERMSSVQMTGTLMAVLGVAIVVLNGRFILHLSPLGDALAFAATLCWAVYSLLMIPANKRYDAVFITRKVFFYGLVTIIPYYFFHPELPNLNVVFKLDVFLNLLFLGSIASMACFLAWTWVMDKLGAIVATNYVYINPLVTIVFAWWILNEQITYWFLLGTVLILIGMYLADKKK